MMAMMEKYANNLEALVDERTDQLVEEKKKTGNIRINYQLNANISLFGSTCFGLYAHLQEHVEPNKLIFALSW